MTEFLHTLLLKSGTGSSTGICRPALVSSMGVISPQTLQDLLASNHDVLIVSHATGKGLSTSLQAREDQNPNLNDNTKRSTVAARTGMHIVRVGQMIRTSTAYLGLFDARGLPDHVYHAHDRWCEITKLNANSISDNIATNTQLHRLHVGLYNASFRARP